MQMPTSFRILYRAACQFSTNGGSQMGAALAYYALFSTAPLLILAIMLAGLFFGEEAASSQVQDFLIKVFSPQTADAIANVMTQIPRPTGGTRAAIVGISLLLIGALGAFLHVRRCLCIIWRLDDPQANSILVTLVNYALSIVAALCVGLLLLVSLIASTAMAVVVKLMHEHLPGGGALWSWLEVGFSFLMLILFFAVVYHVLSSRKIPWRYVWYGSIVSALLFTIGKTLIGMYLAYTTTTSVYGAAGSLVVFLVWVYYSSQIAFFGAELIQARRTRLEWMNTARVDKATA